MREEGWGPAGAWVGVAAWFGAFGALLALTRAVQIDPVAGFVLAFAVTVGVVIAASAGRSLQPPRPALAIAALVLGVALTVLAARVQWPEALRALLAGLGLLLAGTWVGVALGARVGFARYIWPLVIVAVGADVWSVLAPEGLTRQVIEGNAPVALAHLALNVPVPGVGVSPLLGVGDVAFTAFLTGAISALGLPLGRLCLGLAVGFSSCLAGLLALELPLPALPFIGIAGAAALGRHVRPARREVLLAFAVVGVLLGVALGVRAAF